MLLRTLSLSWCVLMCTLAPARSHEIQLGAEQGIDVSNNVLLSSTNPVTDARYRLTPTITLFQDSSPFTYRLDYRPRYSAYFRMDDINGWDQFLRGRAAYQLTGRDQIRFNTDFARTEPIRNNSFTDALGQDQFFATRSGITQRFVADLSIDHGLSPRSVLTLGLNYNRWDYTQSNAVGNQGIGAIAVVNYSLGERWTVGASVDARYRSFDQTNLSPASFSTVLNANLIATGRLTDTLSFELSGGPAGVFSRQSSPGPRLASRWSPVFDPVLCPTGPCGRLFGPSATVTRCTTSFGSPILNTCPLVSPVVGVPGFPDELTLIPVDPNQVVFGRSSETTTYFFSVALIQRFRLGQVSASFVRSEDAASGIGATTILNKASLNAVYRVSDFWTFRLNGSYGSRNSVAQLPTTLVSAQSSGIAVTAGQLAEAGFVVAGTNRRNFDQDIGSLQTSMTRRLSRHSQLRFTFRYYSVTQGSSDLDGILSFDSITGGVFFDYEFDPHKF